MKLYYSQGACSFAPHIVLEEINIPYTAELVSSMDGSTRAPEYLKINPKGRVPVLETGGEIITEAAAIMTYLAFNNPRCGLIGKTPLSIARTVEWMNWLSGVHAFAIAQNWRTERFSDDVRAHEGIQTKGMENLKDIYSLIDQKLRDVKWAVGDEYSIADPYLLVFFRWGNRLGLNMREYKNWTLHAERMEQRAAVITVLEKEEISIWE
ncbi:MAG: glutathione S-transferase family protein [Halopseudomonas aestusnigri]